MRALVPSFARNKVSLCSELFPAGVRLQRRLAVGPSEDSNEQEAERVAMRVTAGSMAGPIRGAAALARLGEATAGASVERTLANPGDALDPGVRIDMGKRFGHDFSRVRIHTDADAAHSARDLGATAYTAGEHIAFAAGRFEPNTVDGRRLIAHELTHVVQQSRGAPAVMRQGPSAPAPSNFTPQQQELLAQARRHLKPKGDAIVGVLQPEKGPPVELMSGGGQGFRSHIEGKATALMEQLGLKKATLLVELEPCEGICDTSTYPGGEQGPEIPKLSKKGEEIPYRLSNINSTLDKGSELTVVGPKTTNIYRGVRPPRVVPGGGLRGRGGGGQPESGAAPGAKPRMAAPESPTPAVRPSQAEPEFPVKPPVVEGSLIEPGVAPGGAVAESALASAAKTVAREVLGHIVSALIFAALDLAVRWALGKWTAAQLRRDFESIVAPQVEARLAALAPKIREAPEGEELWLNVAYAYEFTALQHDIDPVSKFMLGDPPPFYIPQSTRLKSVLLGRGDRHTTTPFFDDHCEERYLALRTEKVLRTGYFSIPLDRRQAAQIAAL
jgi:hypothetical protein